MWENVNPAGWLTAAGASPGSESNGSFWAGSEVTVWLGPTSQDQITVSPVVTSSPPGEKKPSWTLTVSGPWPGCALAGAARSASTSALAEAIRRIARRL